MKKLFALVLSLALVVAFAVPALATGWATLESAPVYKEIGIAVYGLEVTPNTSKVGELYAELAEGYYTVRALTAMAAEHGVELPICEAVNAVLYEGADVRSQMNKLFTRSLKREF